jgi:hypothetical protein
MIGKISDRAQSPKEDDQSSYIHMPNDTRRTRSLCALFKNQVMVISYDRPTCMIKEKELFHEETGQKSIHGNQQKIIAYANDHGYRDETSLPRKYMSKYEHFLSAKLTSE